MQVFSEEVSALAAEIARDGYDWREDGPEVLQITQALMAEVDAMGLDRAPSDQRVLTMLNAMAAYWGWKLNRQRDIFAMIVKLLRIQQR